MTGAFNLTSDITLRIGRGAVLFGSPDPADDLMRARAIREEIGPDNVLMMDANQKWDVNEAIENMTALAEYKPMWIEEPTNCDDVIGHRVIGEALKPLGVGVATGEVAQNKVIFKQLLQPLPGLAEGKLRPALPDDCPQQLVGLIQVRAQRRREPRPPSHLSATSPAGHVGGRPVGAAAVQ